MISVLHTPPFRPRRISGLCFLFLVSWSALCGCRGAVLHDLDEREATRLAVLIEAHGVAVDLEREGGSARGWSLLVDERNIPLARAIVAGTRLPEGAHEEEYGLLGPDRGEQRRMTARRHARELESSLRRLPDVFDARVHLNAAPSGWPNEQPVPRRASVLILSSSGEDERMREDVRALLIGAVDELDHDGLSIVVRRAKETRISEPSFEQLGPWQVAAGSAEPLRWLLGTLIVAVLVLATLFGGVMLKMRRRVTASLSEESGSGIT